MKSSKQTKRKTKQQRSRKDPNQLATVSPTAFRTLSMVFPPRMNLKLKFWALQGLSLAAATTANYRWRPTGAFDIDPALGGTSMAGFAEASTFYSTYRVSGSKIKVTVSNPSATQPITVIVLPLNADPTNAMSAANITACMGNPYAKSKQAPLLGGPPAVIDSSMSTVKIFGDQAIYYDHNFSSLVNTVPANNWFWNVCLETLGVIATNIVVQVEIEVDCEFFDRIFLPA
jgi:hypothetical protein